MLPLLLLTIKSKAKYIKLTELFNGNIDYICFEYTNGMERMKQSEHNVKWITTDLRKANNLVLLFYTKIKQCYNVLYCSFHIECISFGILFSMLLPMTPIANKNSQTLGSYRLKYWFNQKKDAYEIFFRFVQQYNLLTRLIRNIYQYQCNWNISEKSLIFSAHCSYIGLLLKRFHFSFGYDNGVHSEWEMRINDSHWKQNTEKFSKQNILLIIFCGFPITKIRVNFHSIIKVVVFMCIIWAKQLFVLVRDGDIRRTSFSASPFASFMLPQGLLCFWWFLHFSDSVYKVTFR